MCPVSRRYSLKFGFLNEFWSTGRHYLFKVIQEGGINYRFVPDPYSLFWRRLCHFWGKPRIPSSYLESVAFCSDLGCRCLGGYGFFALTWELIQSLRGRVGRGRHRDAL